MKRRTYQANKEKACHVLWLVFVARVSQTQASMVVELSQGTVCHIVHGRRFPDAYPVRPPELH